MGHASTRLRLLPVLLGAPVAARWCPLARVDGPRIDSAMHSTESLVQSLGRAGLSEPALSSVLPPSLGTGMASENLIPGLSTPRMSLRYLDRSESNDRYARVYHLPWGIGARYFAWASWL